MKAVYGVKKNLIMCDEAVRLRLRMNFNKRSTYTINTQLKREMVQRPDADYSPQLNLQLNSNEFENVFKKDMRKFSIINSMKFW